MHVGIFWFVADGGHPHLITDATPLTQADSYGDFLTHPASHYDVWTALQSRPATELQQRLGTTAPRHHEYEDWPRGRIVFHQPTRTFIIYADRQLHRPPYPQRILQAFGLEKHTHTLRTDAHYSRARLLPPSNQWTRSSSPPSRMPNRGP